MYSKMIQLYIQIYIYILFYFPFHYGLLQDSEYSSLCYTVGACCLSILYSVNLLTLAVNFPLPIPFPFSNHMIQQSHPWHIPGENSYSQKYMLPSYIRKDTCIATLFTIVNIWK